MDIKLNILILLVGLLFVGIGIIVVFLKQVLGKMKDIQLDVSILSQKYDESTKRLATKIEKSVATAVVDIVGSSNITPKYDDDEILEEIQNMIDIEGGCTAEFIQKSFNSTYSQIAVALNRLEEDGLIRQSSDVNGNVSWQIADEYEDYEEGEDGEPG